MGTIKLNKIRVYAHHGCLSEEKIIGSEYEVNLKVKGDLNSSCLSDNLGDTIDYVLLNKIVVDEMKIPSKLLEHIAQRILNKIFSCSPLVSWVSVSIAKINPPINGDVERVVVVLKNSRSNL